jgi:DNA replication protein DnaC
MDIKELVKYQVISQMGKGNVFGQVLIFILMNFMDKIGIIISKLYEKWTNHISEKVTETIQPHSTLEDSAISLSTRHPIYTFKMMRNYHVDNKSPPSSEETNGLVDAIITQICKLDNIPSLNLIDNAHAMIGYKEKPIQITRDIYCKIDNLIIDSYGVVNSIRISLLSNTLSASEIFTHVKQVYENHLLEVKNSLGDKIYYFDQKNKQQAPAPPPMSTKEAIIQHKTMVISTAPKQLSFTMAPFYSNKQFSNIRGKEIRLIEKRFNFFLKNRSWYDSKGIPYQLGMLLSGKPGTGKTSTIRAIANLTKRHIINVNFENISTATQLKNLFYSDKIQVYTDQSLNATQILHIPIDQRIYVLEEIDAIGDIVKQRTNTKSGPTTTINDELTLAEILTVLDGTMEIPGRIVIMTSNHPEVLDSALIRPGRIDLNIKFEYAPKELIGELYETYFEKSLPPAYMEELPDKFLSPAEIGEVLFRHFDDCENIDHIVKDLKAAAARAVPATPIEPTVPAVPAAEPAVPPAIEPAVPAAEPAVPAIEPTVPAAPAVPAMPAIKGLQYTPTKDMRGEPAVPFSELRSSVKVDSPFSLTPRENTYEDYFKLLT